METRPTASSQVEPNTTEQQLRRNILEIAYKGQKQVRIAQKELDRQGDQLRASLGRAEGVAKQTGTTAHAVDELISEAKAGKFRKLMNCCLDTCCCCKRSGSQSERATQWEANKTIDKQLQAISPASDKEDHDNEAVVILDSLKSELRHAGGRATNSWKRTLAPQPGTVEPHSGSMEIWFRQVDASLTQLHHIAEDMGQSLDEQIRLAQMLTVYLNYGVDQVIGANERLTKATAEKAFI